MAVPEPGAAACLDEDLAGALLQIEHAGRRRQLRCVEHDGGCRVRVDGRPALSFASCDYLGLARHPRLAAAAARAALAAGTSSGSARLLAGHDGELAALEQELAADFDAPAALVFSSGYLANLGVVTALAAPGDLIVSDRLGHASTVDACRLSGATVAVVPHNDLPALEQALAAAPRHRRTLVLVEGVYSMDGDGAPLAAIVARAEAVGALVVVDDAHGLGAVGPGGRGAAAAAGVGARVAVQIGNLGKALGSFGAFVLASAALRELLVQTSRPFVFTCAPPPPVVAAAREALAVRRDEPQRTERLQQNAARLRTALRGAGVSLHTGEAPAAGARPQALSLESAAAAVRSGASDPAPWPAAFASPIVPVPVGDDRRALEASARLLERGLFVPAVRPPTVPEGSARLRLTVTAEHSAAEVDAVAAAVAEVLR